MTGQLTNAWVCPECGKLLCEDGFTSLERKIEVHQQKHEGDVEQRRAESEQSTVGGDQW